MAVLQCGSFAPPVGARQGKGNPLVRRARRLGLAALAIVLLGLAAPVHAGGFGGITARDRAGHSFELVALASDVDYEVSGLVAEARIHQRFTNQSASWIDAQYLLPLPDGAAVHDLVLHVGQRTIIGEIHEKEEARQVYVEAAASGRRASLVEADRAQLFRTAVANVGPGETIDVEVRWWQQIAFRDDRFELTLPLTYTPRFVPSTPGTDSADGHANADDHHSVDAPTVAVHVSIAAGVPLADVESPSHAVDVHRKGDRWNVDLADGAVPADRDFVLDWTPVASDAPLSGTLIEQRDGETYALAMLLPPRQLVDPLPRELILVIDTSGSMQGLSIQQAKSAIDLALGSLRPHDRFNVIQFNSTVEPLFDHAVPAKPGDVSLARQWVANLRADGGTEIGLALDAALADPAPDGYVRQVVFATDGAIDAADDLYASIERQLGDSRLFTVGIGSAPNAHFIEHAAQLGRGSAIVIRRLDEVEARMRELFAKLDSPALRDVAVRWPGTAESYPERLPDLYAGEPLIAVARLDAVTGRVEAEGASTDGAWTAALDLAHASAAPGIARLWAQRKIEALEHRTGGDGAESTRADIVSLALDFRLVTRYTSLVAVDTAPSAPVDADVTSVRVANGVPAGSVGFAQTATPAGLETRIGLALLALAVMIALASRARDRRRIADA